MKHHSLNAILQMMFLDMSYKTKIVQYSDLNYLLRDLTILEISKEVGPSYPKGITLEVFFSGLIHSFHMESRRFLF